MNNYVNVLTYNRHKSQGIYLQRKCFIHGVSSPIVRLPGFGSLDLYIKSQQLILSFSYFETSSMDPRQIELICKNRLMYRFILQGILFALFSIYCNTELKCWHRSWAFYLFYSSTAIKPNYKWTINKVFLEVVPFPF